MSSTTKPNHAILILRQNEAGTIVGVHLSDDLQDILRRAGVYTLKPLVIPDRGVPNPHCPKVLAVSSVSRPWSMTAKEQRLLHETFVPGRDVAGDANKLVTAIEALTAQELQLAIHVGSGGSPTPAADSADTTTPVVVVKASDYCYCGSEDDTSVRYKQPHLSWCKKSPSTAPSSTATNPPSAGHKLAIIE